MAALTLVCRPLALWQRVAGALVTASPGRCSSAAGSGFAAFGSRGGKREAAGPPVGRCYSESATESELGVHYLEVESAGTLVHTNLWFTPTAGDGEGEIARKDRRRTSTWLRVAGTQPTLIWI